MSKRILTLLLTALCLHLSAKGTGGGWMDYRDPVHDGAADPFVIKDRKTGRWLMFYTCRRAGLNGSQGAEWAHGTCIGIAMSADLDDWTYVQDAVFRGIPEGFSTFWAPSIADDGRVYHMYLTGVPGIFKDWDHPRSILHLVSHDLILWEFKEETPLCSDRVIDPEVERLGRRTWRMWYNSEPGGKLIAYADSRDLHTWDDHGIIDGIRGCEAPDVFRWKGQWWLICDEWKGLAAYRSKDAICWTRQPGNLLETTCDGDSGRHSNVIIRRGHAHIFYFTHPDLGKTDDPGANPRRSTIHHAELRCRKGRLEIQGSRCTPGSSGI